MGAGCWVLGAGCCLLVAGCWLLVVGCWLLVGVCAARLLRNGKVVLKVNCDRFSLFPSSNTANGCKNMDKTCPSSNHEPITRFAAGPVESDELSMCKTKLQYSNRADTSTRFIGVAQPAAIIAP